MGISPGSSAVQYKELAERLLGPHYERDVSLPFFRKALRTLRPPRTGPAISLTPSHASTPPSDASATDGIASIALDRVIHGHWNEESATFVTIKVSHTHSGRVDLSFIEMVVASDEKTRPAPCRLVAWGPALLVSASMAVDESGELAPRFPRGLKKLLHQGAYVGAAHTRLHAKASSDRVQWVVKACKGSTGIPPTLTVGIIVAHRAQASLSLKAELFAMSPLRALLLPRPIVTPLIVSASDSQRTGTTCQRLECNGTTCRQLNGSHFSDAGWHRRLDEDEELELYGLVGSPAVCCWRAEEER